MGTLNIQFNSLFKELEQIDMADIDSDIKEWLQSDIEFANPEFGEPNSEDEYQANIELLYESLLER
jgi:hypothetical protein